MHCGLHDAQMLLLNDLLLRAVTACLMGAVIWRTDSPAPTVPVLSCTLVPFYQHFRQLLGLSSASCRWPWALDDCNHINQKSQSMHVLFSLLAACCSWRHSSIMDA
ncbi:hypothetical protein DUNSADRAFT_9436 [Dunaliella salina]|uniref:Secreted protein n=1 Tax=Dunaliella salina TaxID=3046 RepID=A0ABQ7GHH3_DUNSA|nr:hypothetical protein DUNSADRAFT_9436 [Dunaliella salina]|eukprot:KAF5834045.1 hypothetical protein DUNSADRAFT_9436 [Dunaliella salina]